MKASVAQHMAEQKTLARVPLIYGYHAEGGCLVTVATNLRMDAKLMKTSAFGCAFTASTMLRRIVAGSSAVATLQLAFNTQRTAASRADLVCNLLLYRQTKSLSSAPAVARLPKTGMATSSLPKNTF